MCTFDPYSQPPGNRGLPSWAKSDGQDRGKFGDCEFEDFPLDRLIAFWTFLDSFLDAIPMSALDEFLDIPVNDPIRGYVHAHAVEAHWVVLPHATMNAEWEDFVAEEHRYGVRTASNSYAGVAKHKARNSMQVPWLESLASTFLGLSPREYRERDMEDALFEVLRRNIPLGVAWAESPAYILLIHIDPIVRPPVYCSQWAALRARAKCLKETKTALYHFWRQHSDSCPFRQSWWLVCPSWGTTGKCKYAEQALAGATSTCTLSSDTNLATEKSLAAASSPVQKSAWTFPGCYSPSTPCSNTDSLPPLVLESPHAGSYYTKSLPYTPDGVPSQWPIPSWMEEEAACGFSFRAPKDCCSSFVRDDDEMSVFELPPSIVPLNDARYSLRALHLRNEQRRRIMLSRISTMNSDQVRRGLFMVKSLAPYVPAGRSYEGELLCSEDVRCAEAKRFMYDRWARCGEEWWSWCRRYFPEHAPKAGAASATVIRSENGAKQERMIDVTATSASICSKYFSPRGHTEPCDKLSQLLRLFSTHEYNVARAEYLRSLPACSSSAKEVESCQQHEAIQTTRRLCTPGLALVTAICGLGFGDRVHIRDLMVAEEHLLRRDDARLCGLGSGNTVPRAHTSSEDTIQLMCDDGSRKALREVEENERHQVDFEGARMLLEDIAAPERMETTANSLTKYHGERDRQKEGNREEQSEELSKKEKGDEPGEESEFVSISDNDLHEAFGETVQLSEDDWSFV